MIKNLYPYWYETYHSLEQQGLSQRKIAKEMGIHRTTLQHWLKHPDKVEDMPQEKITHSSNRFSYRNHIDCLRNKEFETSDIL